MFAAPGAGLGASLLAWRGVSLPRAMRHEVEPVVKGLLVVFGELYAARFHFDQAAARPDQVGELGTLVGESDSVFEGAAFRERVGVVPEGGEEMEKESLGFALFVAFKVGGKLGEVAKSFFERRHVTADRMRAALRGWQKSIGRTRARCKRVPTQLPTRRSGSKNTTPRISFRISTPPIPLFSVTMACFNSGRKAMLDSLPPKLQPRQLAAIGLDQRHATIPTGGPDGEGILFRMRSIAGQFPSNWSDMKALICSRRLGLLSLNSSPHNTKLLHLIYLPLTIPAPVRPIIRRDESWQVTRL